MRQERENTTGPHNFENCKNAALERITRDEQARAAYNFLSLQISGADLQSLLLHVYENRTKNLSVRGLKSQYECNRFVQPCEFDQREFNLMEGMIYETIPEKFQAIELSPVNPLGLNALLTKVNQKNVLSTVRNIEVIADTTTALALECAKQRQHGPDTQVDICTNQRTLRLQKYEKGSGFSPHFRIFAMCSAGRDFGHDLFEKGNLAVHISTYLDILKRAREMGYYLEGITITLSDIEITEKVLSVLEFEKRNLGKNIRSGAIRNQLGLDLPQRTPDLKEISTHSILKHGIAENIERLRKVGNEIFGQLIKSFPHLAFLFEMNRLEGIGYYQNFCFKIEARNLEGETYQLADGGFTDWTQVLLSNQKERLLTSGLGTEFMMRMFREKEGNHQRNE